MKKVQRILALAGIILLVGMYIVALVLAIMNNDFSKRWFIAAIVGTIVIPILLWVYQWLYKLVKNDAREAKTKNYIVDDKDNTEDK